MASKPTASAKYTGYRSITITYSSSFGKIWIGARTSYSSSVADYSQVFVDNSVSGTKTTIITPGDSKIRYFAAYSESSSAPIFFNTGTQSCSMSASTSGSLTGITLRASISNFYPKAFKITRSSGSSEVKVIPSNYNSLEYGSLNWNNGIFTVSVPAYDTTYTFKIYFYDDSNASTILYTASCTVKIASPSVTKPSLWSWTSTTARSNAKTAISNKGNVSNFSYTVWNELCDKVMEVLDCLDLTWSNTYASFSSTKMTSSDKKLTAVRFNSLRFNIGSHYSTGISEVKKGDKVYGSYFITLATKINEWINSI